MDTLIVYPKNKEQLEALRSVIKSMKIAFEERHEIYPEKVIKGVKESFFQAQAEDLTPYNGVKKMLREKKP